MKNGDMLDGVKEALDEKKAEVDGLNHRIRAAEEEFERTREITQTQKTKMDTQLEKMEKELGNLRSGVAESVQMIIVGSIPGLVLHVQLVFDGL